MFAPGQVGVAHVDLTVANMGQIQNLNKTKTKIIKRRDISSERKHFSLLRADHPPPRPPADLTGLWAN